MTARLLLTLAIGLAAAATLPAETILYVSPQGNDAHSGRRARADGAHGDGPLATLARALGSLRQLRAAGQLDAGGKVVLLGGTYRFSEPLVLTPEDSGSAGHPLVITTQEGERPVISGGRVIGGWKEGQGGIWQASIPEVKAGQWYFHQLFVGDRRAVRARTPNEGYLRSDGPPAEYPKDRKAIANRQDIRRGIRFKSGDLKASWRNLEDANLVLYHSWTNSIHWLNRIDEAARIVHFSNPSGWPVSWWDREQRYFIENVREVLDAPGEWYLDRTSGLLEYYPRPGEDMRKLEVVAPVVSQLVVVEGDWQHGRPVHDIVFKDINFAHTEWSVAGGSKYLADAASQEPRAQGASITPASKVGKTQLLDGQAADLLAAAVQVQGAERLSFEGCRIAHVGGYGLWFSAGSKHNRVERCEIVDMGAGGIRIGETIRQQTQSKVDNEQGVAVPSLSLDGTESRDTGHNHIDNNFIHEGGRIFNSGIGVFIGHSAYNEVTHNEISDLFYSSVSVGWVWGFGKSAAHHNIIRDNHLHHLGWGVLSDMGGVYSLGPSPGTVVAHNYVHHVNSYAYGGWGLYTDEGSSNIVLENNVVHDTKTGGFHQHYGADNIVRNNIFAFSREAQIQRSREDVECSFALLRNIIYCDNDLVLVRIWRNGDYTVDYNTYWSTAQGTPLFDNRDFDEWRSTSGQDKHSVLADPLFVDAQKRDFRLRPESPALKLGFKPISLSGIGLYGDPSWTNRPRNVSRPEFNLPETAEPMPTALSDDFESTALGQLPPMAKVLGEGGGASIRITGDKAAGGRHSLKFTDAAGLSQTFYPFMNYSLNGRQGVYRVAFDVYLEPGATLRNEWRDAASPYRTGPAIEFRANGDILAGRQKVATVPHGKWIRVEVVAGVGSKVNGRYELTLTPSGSPPQKFGELPHTSKDFAKFQWLGFTSNANGPAAFYIDNLQVECQ